MNYPVYSYNSLMVPLDLGTWQCELVLSREYDELVLQRQRSRRNRLRSGSVHRSTRTHSRSWTTSWSAFDRDDDEEVAERRQREDDRRTFLLYFRPKYEFRQLIASDINAIASFLLDHLNVAHWDLPTDNAGIEHALKQAVADGKLVPVVNRNWRSFPMTFRPAPAPLRWPPSVGSPMVQAVPYGGGLSAAVSTAPVPPGAETDSGSAGDGGSGFDWLDDARPFEFTPNMASGDIEKLAASTNNPRYAAKMLGYTSQQFRGMVHRFKDANGIGPDDDLHWHDNGDVYFNGEYIDNFHDYGN